MDPRLGGASELGHVARAARILAVRSRREAAGLLVGAWRSAFRGGGVEFEESRPYVPGDDVRAIDWNATARTGLPWVKRFREERSCSVLVALDVSASMAFGTTGRTKAETGALVTALVSAAATRAGDPVGFVAFADGVRAEVEPGRGDAHTWRVLRAAATSAARPRGTTDLGIAAEWVRAHVRRRSLVIVLSDFRGELVGAFGATSARSPAARYGGSEGARFGRGQSSIAVTARRHDLVAAVLEDPRERALVAAGSLAVIDPESGAKRRLLSTRRRARESYEAAARARRERVSQRLRAEGADLLWLSTGDDPLHALVRFFRARGVPRRGVA